MADLDLRRLERVYRKDPSVVNLLALNRASLRVGRAMDEASTDQMRQLLKSMERTTGAFVFDDHRTFPTHSAYLRALERCEGDPTLRAENRLLALEIKRDILNEKLTADQYKDVTSEISEMAEILGWTVARESLDLGRDIGPRSERTLATLEELGNHIMSISGWVGLRLENVVDMGPEAIAEFFDRLRGSPELEDIDLLKENFYEIVDRARLRRRIFLVHPAVMHPSGYIARPRLLADCMRRYETFMHAVIRHDYRHSESYIVQNWHAQVDAFSAGHYHLPYEEAVQEYLRRVLCVPLGRRSP